MASKNLTDKQLMDAMHATQMYPDSLRLAAESIGVPRETLRHRLAVARERFGQPSAINQPRVLAREIDIKAAPDPHEPIEELLARKKAAMKRAMAYEEYENLIPVSVKQAGPIGLLLVGDPHVDDDGCDIEALERDLTTVGKTPSFYAGHVGDFTNSWVGRLAALYANQSTTFGDGLRIAEWMFGLCPNLFVVAGNHDCLDKSTECLTRRGWIPGAEVAVGDEVWTMNTDTGLGEWQAVLDKIDRRHSGDMIQVKSLSLDALVTPNHRWLCSNKSVDQFSYVTADSLPSYIVTPVASTPAVESEYPISDAMLELVGWALTDGSIIAEQRKVVLYQSKEVARIRDVLARAGVPYRENVRERDIKVVCGKVLKKPPLPSHEFYINGDGAAQILSYADKKGALPAWMEGLSTRQFDLLLDTMIAADGTWDGMDPSEKRCGVLHKDAGFLESVQALAVRRGWYARIAVARTKDYRLNLCRRKALTMSRAITTKTVKYDGDVWCVTVPNSNFMVRRNGRAYFTGNCWNNGADLLKFVLRQQPNSGHFQAHGARLRLTWPNGKEIRIHARHDFPGHSQYNPTHGHRKETLWGHRDHILVAGHRHTDAASVIPAVDGTCHWMFRVSGYKVIDEYAKQHRFMPQRMAPSAAVIINPDAATPAEVVKPFWDTEAAADYLKFLRARVR